MRVCVLLQEPWDEEELSSYQIMTAVQQEALRPQLPPLDQLPGQVGCVCGCVGGGCVCGGVEVVCVGVGGGVSQAAALIMHVCWCIIERDRSGRVRRYMPGNVKSCAETCMGSDTGN